ncbi:MAG TPA: DoxX family protein [Longimicrobiaceae bacterium]|nr:DoxX family protein [Longimicrobiaceae bacterium]
MAANGSARYGGWGLTLLRVVVGVVFIMHGKQKLFDFGFDGVSEMFSGLGVPLPEFAAVGVSLLEFGGGIALVLGLLTRPVALLLAADMAVATLLFHLPKGFYNPGVEFTLTLFAACIALALNGPGEAALDRVIGRRRGPGAGSS